MSIASKFGNANLPVDPPRSPCTRSGLLVAVLSLSISTSLLAPLNAGAPPKVAALVTIYYHNSHADVIVSRLLQTMTLDGKGRRPNLTLASLYIDQPKGSRIGLELAHQYHVPVYSTPSEALTLGGKNLAVDGVLLVGEHGSYPLSATGQVEFPKRRLFTEILSVFDRSKHVVPVFSDKHLSDNWTDAKWIYDSARTRGIPLMAGSSLPTLWRYPPVDVPPDAHLSEIVATSYGGLEAYGFHSLEVVQCLVERRHGGETGIRSVQAISGDDVWKPGVLNPELFSAALSRSRHLKERRLEDLKPILKKPVVFRLIYRDGLRATILCTSNAIDEFLVSWRNAGDGKIASTLFWTQEGRPYMHFAYLVQGIEELINTGKEPRPVERTLLTTGALNALFQSYKQDHSVISTPWLDVHYKPTWNWTQPPPPPPTRPSQGQ